MNRFLLICFLALIPLAALAEQPTYWLGATGLTCEQAFADSKAKAERGDPVAQVEMAIQYRYGCAPVRSDAEFCRWNRLAAEQGYAAGAHNLAQCYQHGVGLERNYAEAVRWYSFAAENGNASAMGELGILHADGNGVAKDIAKAYRLCRTGARAGNTKSQECYRDLINKYGPDRYEALEANAILPPAGSSDCPEIAGDWRWFNGGAVDIGENNQLSWKPTRDSAPAATGVWKCIGDRGFVVHWSTGFTDTLRLSEDGMALAGTNIQGAQVWAVRAP
jgi:hypothetical protein